MKLPLALSALFLVAACTESPEPLFKDSPKRIDKKVVEYPLEVTEPWTTLRKTWQITEASPETMADVYAGLFQIDQIGLYAGYGLGEVAIGGGESHVRYENFASSPTPGTRRSLLYFAQHSDWHIIDEESPVRLEGVTRIAFASAYRPQDHLTTQLVDALVRTMNEFSFEDRPFDFVFISGDVADNGQENEVYWVRQLFDGERIWPDSGAVDDPLPGPGNDFTDPFQAAGIDKRVPWYMLFGNHDQMHLGSFDPLPRITEGAVSDRIQDFWGLSQFTDNQVTFGARDASRPNAPVLRVGATIPADAHRKMLSKEEFMTMFVTSPTEPKGHGFTAEAAKAEQTSYSVRPVKDFPLTMIAIDTVMELILDANGEPIQHAGSEGEISRELWDGFIVPELDAAKARGDLIIVASHHCTESIQEGVSEVDRAEIRSKLMTYPTMLAYLCGHGHRSRAWFWQPSAAPEVRGFPELMQASAIDFPIQGRILELVDNADGTLSIFTTQVEPNVLPGSLAYEGLVYAAAAHNFPPVSLLPEHMWYTDKPHRNMEIVLPVPPGFNVAGLPGRGQIESLTRLK